MRKLVKKSWESLLNAVMKARSKENHPEDIIRKAHVSRRYGYQVINNLEKHHVIARERDGYKCHLVPVRNGIYLKVYQELGRYFYESSSKGRLQLKDLDELKDAKEMYNKFEKLLREHDGEQCQYHNKGKTGEPGEYRCRPGRRHRKKTKSA